MQGGQFTDQDSSWERQLCLEVTVRQFGVTVRQLSQTLVSFATVTASAAYFYITLASTNFVFPLPL